MIAAKSTLPKAGLFSALALVASATGLAIAWPAEASKTMPTMPVSELKVGMRGHALTVFKGEHTDKFEIEIVDVMKNYLPKQDAILFKSNDPRLQHSGIVGGMSGSPIFIDGKLVGALAYGWPFNKDPLGALTPIANMKEVGRLPYRPDILPHPKRGKKRRGTKAWADTMLGLETSPLPARRRADALDPSTSLMPLMTPLSVNGMGNTAARMLGDAFGMMPVRGGGRGKSSAPNKPRGWDFGDAVAVVLVEGDSGVAGNGTVTWVSPKGDRLLAFGHSMFEDGPSNIPIAHSKVNTIINSVQRSVKLSSPQEIVGVMYQDRQAAIALRTDVRTAMIPVTSTIQGPDPEMAPRVYNNRVAFGVTMTPNLVSSLLAEAIDEAGRDATEVVFKITHELAFETEAGPRDIKIVEEVFFSSGLIGRIIGGSRGILTILAALDNDFEVARIRSIRHNIEMQYGAPVDRIEQVRLRTDIVRAGDLLELEVHMRDYQGKEHIESLPLRIPDDAGGQELMIEVAAGDMVRPYRPQPANLDDLLTTMQATYPSRAMVASIYRQSEGLSTKHGLVSNLPDSVLETLVNRGSTRSAVKFKHMSRRVIPTKKLIEGIHTIKVSVKRSSSF